MNSDRPTFFRGEQGACSGVSVISGTSVDSLVLEFRSRYGAVADRTFDRWFSRVREELGLDAAILSVRFDGQISEVQTSRIGDIEKAVADFARDLGVAVSSVVIRRFGAGGNCRDNQGVQLVDVDSALTSP